MVKSALAHEETQPSLHFCRKRERLAGERRNNPFPLGSCWSNTGAEELSCPLFHVIQRQLPNAWFRIIDQRKGVIESVLFESIENDAQDAYASGDWFQICIVLPQTRVIDQADPFR